MRIIIIRHLVGIFHRTCYYLSKGIKPVWVFDGTPPLMKKETLQKREKSKKDAENRYEEALKNKNSELALKMFKRKARISAKMIEDSKEMLKLLGVPIVVSPSEAEKQCAGMCKNGDAYGVASEDMDTLAFGASKLIRNFNNSKEPITEIDLNKLLECLEISQDQFIDLSILCGCDFAQTIKGIGPVKALNLIKEFKCIENIIPEIEKMNSDKKIKYVIPTNFDYKLCREIFNKSDSCKTQLSWNPPNVNGLHKLLVEDMSFSEVKFQNGIKKMSVI